MEQVIQLWEAVFGYDAAHNAPAVAIDRKVQMEGDLFFVALERESVVGTVLAGYDGYRGWLYSVAVRPLAPKERYRSIACPARGAGIDRARLHEDKPPDPRGQRKCHRLLCIPWLCRVKAHQLG